MRTIGRKRSPASPNGDVHVLCSYCGVLWYRSQLVRDGAGNLACPDDAAGMDIVTLSLGNAAEASNRRLGRYRQEIDGTFDTKNKVPSPGFVNPNGPPSPPSSPGLPFNGQTALNVAHNSYWHDTKTFTQTAIGAAPFSYMLHDQSARLRLLTSGTLTVGAVATTGNTQLGDTVDVRVDGVYFATLQYPDAVSSSVGVRVAVSITLPAGMHTVDLVEQNCFITDISGIGWILPASASTPQKSFVAVGASGTMGYYAWDESSFIGGKLVFDLSWRGRVCWSGRFDECYCVATNGFGLTSYGVIDQPSAIAFDANTVAPRATGAIERTYWYEFGAGEQIGNLSTPTVYAANLTFLCNATHARDPNGRVFLQTPIIINSPAEGTPNAGGFTMQDFRNVYPGIKTSCPFVTIIDGYTGGGDNAMSKLTSDLQDGRHFIPGFPVTHIAGHVRAWNWIQPKL